MNHADMASGHDVRQLTQRVGAAEEVNRQRQQKEARQARGEAAELPGKPEHPVGLPSKYWGDRQREQVQEFLMLLPIVQAAVPMPPLDERMNPEDFDAEVARRTESLVRAFKTVRDTVRKGV